MAYKSSPQVFNKVKNGVDGTSVTILGSYASESALKNAHPTGNAGDSYLVGGYLYVWNGTAWENVGNIQGPKGDPGDGGPQGPTGTSVTSVATQYYVSTSKTSTTGGSWSTSTPKWEYGKYLWKREVVTYSDGTTTYSTAYCDNTWEAVTDVDKQILDWCYQNNRAYINGNKIYAKTITAGALNVETLSSITANIGTITAGEIVGGVKITSKDGDDTGLVIDKARITLDSGNSTDDTYHYEFGLLGIQAKQNVPNYFNGEFIALPHKIELSGAMQGKTDKTIFKADVYDETVECYKLKITNEIIGLNNMIANLGYLGKSAVNKIWKQQTFTSSTSMADTGVSVTIPKNSYYVMVITALYHNAKPTQLRVEESPIIQGVLSLVGETGTHISTTVCGYTLESNASTITVKAQYQNANQNTIRIMGFYITL